MPKAHKGVSPPGVATLFGLAILLLAPCLLAETFTGAPNADEEGASHSSELKGFWRSWYGAATHLLPTVGSTAEAAEEEQRLVKEVQLLASALRREERLLGRLLDERMAIKQQKWTWFLDPELRKQVDEAGLKVCLAVVRSDDDMLTSMVLTLTSLFLFALTQINNQRRKVEALFDDISVHWRQLKPLHGVLSRMFMWELFAFLVAPILSVLDFFGSALSFGILFFFLLLGPAALFFGMFAFSLGLALLPLIGAFLVVLWTFEFPWMIIQVPPLAEPIVVPR